MLSPAGDLVVIEPGENYQKDRLLYSLHCTKTNECPVVITTYSGSTVEFPVGSFVRGAVYHIYLRTAEFEKDKAGFIGYRYWSVDI